VQDGCNFFCWADPPEEDGREEIAKLKKKVGTLKLWVKTAEWRLKVALVGGLVGWVCLLCLWVYDSAKMKPPYVRSVGLL
ncbi:hypothetical protein PIB30_099947, partial [Stylosanthes scabra]|nr:hypothetical protein [Stylosanthes scabra]